jgi:hypothetical protein
MSYTQYMKSKSASFDTTSDSPETEQLFEYEYPKPPKVFYTDTAWATIRYLVDSVSTEVGWLGLVETETNDKDEVVSFTITDIYIPEQKVNGAETDIAAETLCDLAVELEESGKESEKLIYWGHSHVNMGVSPSTQDEVQVEEFLDNGCKLFIRGIYNKHGHSKVDIYDVDNNCAHQCVWNGPMPLPIDKNFSDRLDKLIKKNVKQTKSYMSPIKKPALGQQISLSFNNRQPTPSLLSTEDYYGSYWDDPYRTDELVYRNPVDGDVIQLTQEELDGMDIEERETLESEYNRQHHLTGGNS